MDGEMQPLSAYVLVVLQLTPIGTRESVVRGQLLLERPLSLAEEEAELTCLGVCPSVPWIALRL